MIDPKVKKAIANRAAKMAKDYAPLIERAYIDETWDQDRYVCVVFEVAGNKQTRIRVETDADERWEEVYKMFSLPKKMPKKRTR